MALDANTVEITTRKGVVYSVAFTEDGKHVVGGEAGSTLRQWRIEDRIEVGPTMKANGDVLAVAVSKDGRWIVAGDRGHRVIVWNAMTHMIQLQKKNKRIGEVWAVDVSLDSTRFAFGSHDGTVRVVSITSGGTLIATLPHDCRVAGVKFSPDGNRLATATYQNNSVRVYDAHTGSKLFDIPVSITSPNPSTPLAWSPDSQRLFAASYGKITHLNISTSARSEWPTYSTDSHCSIATNGKFIACSSGDSVSFWDAVSYQQIGRPVQHSSAVYCIALSRDQRHLACGNGSKISIHNLSDILPETHFVASEITASYLPLMELSDQVLQSCMQDDIAITDAILSEEISLSPQPNHYALANRALVRARLKQWTTALEDAITSLQIRPSPIGHIAKALALVGKGEHELALQAFDLVFHDCDPNDNRFLLLAKAILLFVSGKHENAISRLDALIIAGDDDAKWYYYQVLSNMYMMQRDYDRAVETFERSKQLPPSQKRGQLETISFIYGWRFDTLEFMSWKRLCESLYTSGRIKEAAETLMKMVDPLEEGKKEAAHGRILEEIITRSGEVTLLAWAGSSSTCNSCLPASPSVYKQTPYTPPSLEGREMETRIAELRNIFSPTDAMLIYGRVTGLQALRFANFRLLLPCIIFPVKGLSKDGESAYRARVTALGNVEFTTADLLPLKEPRKVVLVYPWIHDICGPRGGGTADSDADSDVGSNPDSESKVDVAADMVHESLFEEVPPAPSDVYTQSLQLIARLGQPFSALLLLRQSDGSYKRVAAEHEIVAPELGNKVPKDIRAEVLEIQ